MKTRFISLLTALAFVMLSAMPACAIVLDGYNRKNEYGTDTNKAVSLIDNAVESGNVEVYWAQAYVKTEGTLCYILFNVMCKGNDVRNSKAGVIIEAEGETLKADMTQEPYDGYDRNKFDFAYVAVPKAGGFTIEVRINFKNGLGDGKTITVHVMNTSGEVSAFHDLTVKKSEPATVTTTEKTTKPTTEKTTTERTTKPTTEKTTKEKTTKPTTAKTTKPTTTKPRTTKATTTKATTAKAKTTVQKRTNRDISHKVVTTTVENGKKRENETATVRTTKAQVTKFRAKQNVTTEQTTRWQGERITGTVAATGIVSYSYITEYTTSSANGGGSSHKKKAAAFASATLVIVACVIGVTSTKKEKTDKND